MRISSRTVHTAWQMFTKTRRQAFIFTTRHKEDNSMRTVGLEFKTEELKETAEPKNGQKEKSNK